MTPICFGRYVLVDRIARGGMGEVFVAIPMSLWGLEKYFAVKKILPALSQDPEFLQRFQDEARLVIPMNHPNVVQVIEVGRVDEEYFISMEHVEGTNLNQLLGVLWKRRDRFQLPIPAALYIIRELLKGLSYCHQRTNSAGIRLNVVHRDVSPDNVLLSYEGRVKLTDFGLALSSLKVYQTKPNLLLGHLGYIAPEAMDGHRVDLRADIYSAGVLLFELLTCQRFAPEQNPEILRQLIELRSGLRPSRLRREIPREVDTVVGRAVAIRPEDRFQTAQQFQEAVQLALLRLDPHYGARRLLETTMEPLFHPAQRREELRRLVRRLDREELEDGYTGARTVCIGEAIPLSRQGPVLTLMGEGDTEPIPIQPNRQIQQTRDETSTPTPWRSPGHGRRRARFKHVAARQQELSKPEKPEKPKKWLEIKTVQ